MSGWQAGDEMKHLSFDEYSIGFVLRQPEAELQVYDGLNNCARNRDEHSWSGAASIGLGVGEGW